MASWKWPNILNKMLSDVPGINVLLNALLKQDVSGTTDVPAGAKQWVDTPEGKQFQVFNGQSWASVGKLAHDAASVDGKSVSVSVVPDTIPVRDASGKIPGDITGNAATATKANELSEANPVAMGGTGATTAEQARTNLGTPPKSHAASSTEYGIGTSTLYGHLKSHDEPDSTLTAATGHAFSPAGAAAMQGEIDDKLSTRGGTMTGPIYADNTAMIGQYENRRLGFAASSGKAGALNLFGRYLEGDYAGAAELVAENDDNRSTLVLFPNGLALINGTHIVRSVNGTNADEAGNVTVFPSGTKMLFNQAAAPTGWTKQTSVDNAALRVVSGKTGGGTGGSLAFSTLFATGRAVSLSGNVGATTLTAAQIPSHYHYVVNTSAKENAHYANLTSSNYLAERGSGESNSKYKEGYFEYWLAGSTVAPTTARSSSQGSSGSHTHTLSGTAQIALNVKYTDVIICAKD